MPGSHSLNFLGMCSCSALPQREICAHWTLLHMPVPACQSIFSKPWNLAGCQLYTVHMACHWPSGVYSS